MKIIKYLILLIIVFSAYDVVGQSQANDNVKNLVMGRWQRSNNRAVEILFTADTLFYLYKGEITGKNKISFFFNDDSKGYQKKLDVYDFTKNGKESSLNFFFQEYTKEHDTITTFVSYLDRKKLKFDFDNGSITYRKQIKTKM